METAAKSLQTELQHSKSQEDAWNNSSLELLRASDVRLWHFLQFDFDTLEYYIIQMTCVSDSRLHRNDLSLSLFQAEHVVRIGYGQMN